MRNVRLKKRTSSPQHKVAFCRTTSNRKCFDSQKKVCSSSKRRKASLSKRRKLKSRCFPNNTHIKHFGHGLEQSKSGKAVPVVSKRSDDISSRSDRKKLQHDSLESDEHWDPNTLSGAKSDRKTAESKSLGTSVGSSNDCRVIKPENAFTSDDHISDHDSDVIYEHMTVPEDEVICLESDDDTDDGKIQMECSNSVNHRYPHQDTCLEKNVSELRKELHKVQQNYEAKLQIKEDQIKCLQNEIRCKNEMLEAMNRLAAENMKLEAHISLMLGDKEEYEKEVTKMKEREKGNEQTKKEKVLMNKNKEKEKSKEKRKTKEDKSEKSRIPSNTQADDHRKDEIDAYFIDDDDDDDLKVTKEEKPLKAAGKGAKSEVNHEMEEDKVGYDECSTSKSRHSIRKLMTSTKLQDQTRQAARDEKKRIERSKKEHDKHLRVVEARKGNKEPITKRLVLAFKEGTKTPLVEVSPKLISKLKPHQVDAVEFIWDNIIESMDRLKEGDEGSGCILAHCMGLGKTLSVIAVIHTLLTTKCIGFRHCLIVCPLNTVLNWQYELEKWLDKKERLKVFELATYKNYQQRRDCLEEWRQIGGVMITGYQLFRILTNYSGRSKKTKKIIEEALLDPGPDVIVCDEGHILKNDQSAISKCMNKIKTKRRIVLTGTPLQNNLVEYHCMVNFVKPNLLGSRREFNNRFVNPITNGQHADSTSFDVKLMKWRAHILHSMLDGCVQRRDYSALTKFLPPKYEYVLSIRLSSVQIQLYKKYLDLCQPEAGCVSAEDWTEAEEEKWKSKGSNLFNDYQNLMRIWTHPWLLKLDEARQDKKPFTEYDDDLESILFTSSSEDEFEEGINTLATSQYNTETALSSSLRLDSNHSILEREKHKRSASGKAFSPRKVSKCMGDDLDTDNFSQRTRQCQTKADKARTSARKKNLSKTELNIDESENSTKLDKNHTVKKCKKKADRKPGDDEPSKKVKVMAGEVIKHWQTQSRRTGKEDELIRKKQKAWWSIYITDDMKTQIELGGKLVVMFEIIHMAECMGDKVLVFSQSVLTLDLIEKFLSQKNQEAKNVKGKRRQSLWEKDVDYCRMDGSTGVHSRRKLTCNFNCLKNKRMRLFLISTKAGGLGINLDSANRVIIFDASWNPSHDIQSIFRVYRFGQEKPVFVYRLLAQGTMEEKIYERQVTKETLSQRVIDEHQIDRHFTSHDLQELYDFRPDKLDDPNREKRPTPVVPKDLILAELLSSRKEWIVQYHEHDSLLENRPEEELSEEERRNAWEEYEREKQDTFYRMIQPNCDLQLQNMDSYNSMSTLPIGPAEAVPSVVLPTVSCKHSTHGPMASIPFIDKGNNPNINLQNSQLPKVIQEIIKYNPSISYDELKERLQTFLGMNNCYSQLPGFPPGLSKVLPVNRTAPASGMNLPSRLPLPGPVPANRQ